MTNSLDLGSMQKLHGRGLLINKSTLAGVHAHGYYLKVGALQVNEPLTNVALWTLASSTL